jgi:uncharacterized protein (TIGR03437 family)
MWRGAIFVLFAAAALGQPFVYYRGAVNAASYLRPGLPNGSIAQGSMFSIFGRNLGPASPQLASAFPLQPTLAGVSVELRQGTTMLNALPFFVSAGQLNVILPSNTPVGAVSLRVIYNGQTGNPIPINVSAASIGLFSVNGEGFGPGIVQNVVSQTSQPINSLTTTARPGQAEILWGTGIGAATFSDAIAPLAVTLDSTLELFVGGKKAVVSYAGRAHCCAAIDQILFTVPADTPTGCYVPVVARSRGVVVSNTVTMAIDQTGGACSDAHNPLNQARAGGKIAIAQLARQNLHVDVNVSQPYDLTLDHLLAAFRNSPASDFYFNALAAPPPLGTCTTYGGGADSIFGNSSPFGPPGAQINPGGPLRVEASSASASAPVTAGYEGTFYSLLGLQGPPGTAGPPGLLNTGPFTLVGAAFRAALDNVAPLNWTNRGQITTVMRTGDLVLTWSAPPGASRAALITGFGENRSQNAVSGFVCLASPGATSFTLPSYVLAAIPASDDGGYFSSAEISLVNAPVSGTGSLPGFDASFLGMSAWSTKTVVIK